jgi:hypothetical protein
MENNDGFYDWNFKFVSGGIGDQLRRIGVNRFKTIELFQREHGTPIKYKIDCNIIANCVNVTPTERTYQLIIMHNFIGSN